MTRLIIIGAGGHARVVTEALLAAGVEIAGFVTNIDEQGKGAMKGMARIGTDRDLLAQSRDAVQLVNGVGSTGDPQRRIATFETFRAAGFAFATVTHPGAIIASDAILEEGAQIMAGAVLQPGVRVGMNAIVNSGAIIDHDSSIGAHAHIAPGACLAGDVTVGIGTHIGAGATVIQNIKIAEHAVIAAGAVVVKNVAAATIVMGVPARVRSGSPTA